MVSFKGKKILIICPSFFDYSSRIKNELTTRGAIVTYWDERPKSDFVSKMLIRTQNNMYKKYLDKYYFGLINQCNEDFDYIVCIVCETESELILKKISSKYKSAKKILYLWDSMKNKKGIEKKFKYFDAWYSFDQEDIKKHPKFKYAYWGYTSEFDSEKQKSYKYDLTFLGTAHSIRPFVLYNIKKQCDELNIKYYFYIYQTNILLYLYNKFRNPNFKYLKLKDIRFKIVNQETMIEIYKNSKVILDISSVNQSGMTTRVGEMIGLNKKIMTNNFNDMSLARKYPSNFYMYDSLNPIISRDFFELEYQSMETEDIYKYSFENFLQTIFGE
jgi:hypothetical protein